MLRHAAEDKKKTELIEARNKADQLCYQTEKFVKEGEGKLSSGVKDDVTKAIDEVRKLLKENGEKEALDAAVSKLESASQKIYEEISKAAQQPPQPEPQPEPAGAAAGGGKKQAEGDVIDADFKVVDEKK